MSEFNLSLEERKQKFLEETKQLQKRKTLGSRFKNDAERQAYLKDLDRKSKEKMTNRLRATLESVEPFSEMMVAGGGGFTSAAPAEGPVAGFDPMMTKKPVKRKKKEKKNEEFVAEARDGKSAKDKDYSLHDWFKGGGWKQTGGKYDGKPCAKQPGQTTKPFCRDADDRANMSKDERDRRAAKKRREDPDPDRKGKAKMVHEGKTFENFIEEEKDACYHKVKASAKVWPSAYASGRLVQCRKKGASNYGKSKKKDS